MQSSRSLPASPRSTAVDTPTLALGRHIRWQVMLALGGVLLLVSVLGFSMYTVAVTYVPDKGGVFREGVAGEPFSINPLLDSSDTDNDLTALLFRGLTRIDERGRMVGDLAESWTITNDTDYTFRLKPDQRWHDGAPITTDDVMFTIGILRDPSVQGLPVLTRTWRSVEVERVDDLTVRFSLSEPYAPFLEFTSIGLLPEHLYGELPAVELASDFLPGLPVGSGPFRITEMTAEHVRLEPNPLDDVDDAFIEALDMRFYPDSPSLITAFGNQEIDGISRILPSSVDAVSALEDLTMLSTVQAGYASVRLNLDSPNAPFFQEKLVRQALYYGLDRDALINDAVVGQGVVAHSLFTPNNWAYSASAKRYNYDPQQANALLDEAGWTDSDGDGVRDKAGQALQFVLHTNNDDPVHRQLVELIASQWAELGVRAVPTPDEIDLVGLAADVLTRSRFDAVLATWLTGGDPDPYSLWHSSQADGGGQNYGKWRDERADALLEQARATTDINQRRELYAQFQDIFAEEVPALMLYHPVYSYGVSNRIHNAQIGDISNPSQRFNSFADWYIVTRRVPVNQLPTATPVAEGS